MSTLPPLVDPEALALYLNTQVSASDAPLEIERIRGGHSNETFFVTRGQDAWVLRRPPRGPLLPTAHDVAREYRVIQALTPTNVPVPTPIHLCTDASVIGVPFYLMSRVDGVILRHELPETFQTEPSTRAAIGVE